jgi:predicted nucleic acid-binding protein
MTILVDTNVLLRSTEFAHPHQPIAALAIKALDDAGHSLAVAPQVIYEFWVVATRPVAQNGLGLGANRVTQQVEEIQNYYSLLHDDAFVFDHWLALMAKPGPLGKSAHDARLVAAMLRHGVTHLLTFNVADFARYSGIIVVAPDVAAVLPPGI